MTIDEIKEKYSVGTVHLLNSLHDASLIQGMLKDVQSLLYRIEEFEEGIELLKSVDGHGVNMPFFIDAKRKLYKLVEKK